MKLLMGAEDVVSGSSCENFESKWLILEPKALNEKYREARYQLWYCTGGFGADPEKIGRKVFGIFAADPDDTQFIAVREEIIGVATDEAVENWKKTYPDVAENIDRITRAR